MSEMTLEWPVGVYNNVHGLGVLHSSHLGVGKIALALCNNYMPFNWCWTTLLAKYAGTLYCSEKVHI